MRRGKRRRDNKKLRIILFNPPLYFSKEKAEVLDVSVPPLGLLYLASYLQKHLSEVGAEVIDIAAEKFFWEEIRKRVVIRKPFLVGMTAMTPQLQGALQLAGFLKKNFPWIKIILGGPHVSADSDFVKRFAKFFDYAITGEGEKTFCDLVAKFMKGKRVPRIQSGEIISDLDLIPFPDRKLISREKYSPYESMMFSRGCPFHCYYCSRPSISCLVRYRSAANLLQEIREVYSYCQGRIDFQDDTFTLRRDRVVNFCQMVKESGLKLGWRCNTRIDLVDTELLSLMKEAGCELIHFGIEAGNEKIRKEVVNKGQFTNRDIYRVIRDCHRVGIKFAGYFILGHPGEGRRELEQTKKMILESGIDLMGLSIPTPFPGSRLYEIARGDGVISEVIVDRFARGELGQGYVGNYPLFVSKCVSQEEIFSLMREINRRFYVNWRTFWRRLKEDLGSVIKLRQDFTDLVALIRKGVSSRKPYVT